MKNRLKGFTASSVRHAFALGALVVPVLGACGISQSYVVAAHAEAAAPKNESLQLTETATKAVDAWVHAVGSGNPETVRNFLAPEFQILRSDGRGYDRAGYLASGLPKIDSIIGVQDVVPTASGNHIVVRYIINLKETVSGKTVQQTAPRLTVFRREGGRWLVVAHANFARIGK